MVTNSKKKKTLGHYIRTLREQDKPFRYLISRLLWKTHLSRPFMIRKGAYKLRFYSSSASASCWYDPLIYKGDENFFEIYLKRGDTVIDVGANIGVLTLKAAAIVGDGGKVFSIEAHPTTFRYLRGNVCLNHFGNIEVFNVAVGNKRGVVEISDRKTSDVENRIVPEGGTKIKVETLDTLLNHRIKTVDLLKIDVEGYEKFVLAGAAKILEKTKCIYIECWERHFANYGYSTTCILETLKSSGFGVFKVVTSRLSEISSRHISESIENLLAIRDLADFRGRTGFTVAK
jgi:FkbM family methyltransferase